MGLNPSMAEYLLTGAWPCDDNGVRLIGLLAHVFQKTDADIAAVWREHRAELLSEWRRRGQPGRPWGARFDDDPHAWRLAEEV
jgi:hypothetical protein